MNILHVTLGFYPAQAWGGPAIVVRQNGRELVRRGHSVTVYCTNLMDKQHTIQPGTFERRIDGMRIVYFNVWHIPRWPGTLGPMWPPRLPGFLKQELPGFDIVHLNGYRGPMMFAVARAARRSGVPFVTQPHGMLPINISSFWAKRVYDLAMGSGELKGVSALLALNESERRQALARGISANRIEIIPNGIDPEERDQLPAPGSFRRRFGLAADKPVVLFLGRINKIKGTDLLVEAFARLKDPAAQLVIAGPDDGQLSQVRELIRQYDLEQRVVLPGLLKGPDVLAALQDSDLFVLPSRADAFPVTVMEACLVGIPMVLTDRCEIAESLRDRVADVVPFDAEALADAIGRLLTDKARRERYRANGREVFERRFTVRAVVDRLEEVYLRLAPARSARQSG